MIVQSMDTSQDYSSSSQPSLLGACEMQLQKYPGAVVPGVVPGVVARSQ